MKTLWITLTVLSIISQIPHAYWSIEQFSIIKNKSIRVLQNAAFCVIISVAIFGFVIEGLHWAAFAGAVVEIVINIYYFQQGMSGMSEQTRKKKWLRHVLAVLIPMSVYFFSMMITYNK